MDLNLIWFGLVGVLLTGYAILDGFDLGVGILSLFARSEEEKRIHMNAIGPVWDGNEVWLLTGGGALFAAFPLVYATAFSAFYLALMLVVVALIGRAAAFEFRGKSEALAWRRSWDLAFGLGSLVASLLYGVAVGNVVRGIPLDEAHRFTGGFLGLLNPYALLIGVTTLALFTMQGAAWMALKSEGGLQTRMRAALRLAWAAFVLLFAGASVWTLRALPHAVAPASSPLLWILLGLLVLAALSVPVASVRGRDGRAFLASSLAVVATVGLAAVGMFPRLLVSSTDLANSLTAYNAASTPLTQTVMLVIALVGMPFVIGYTAWVYSVFKGKVELGPESY